jgi:hypothetical protein
VARTVWREVGAVERKSCGGAEGVDEKRMNIFLQKKTTMGTRTIQLWGEKLADLY